MRVIKANGLDLDLFQFDYDQTWCVMFLNADRTIYGRYGTRSGGRKSADTYLSLRGFKKATARALEAHEGYPANQAQLVGHTGPRAKFPVPEKNPALHKSACIHCHQVHDGMLRHKWLEKQLTATDLWVYPLPENIGMKMDIEDCLTVKKITADSPAAKGGIEPGDRLVSINGLRLVSQADIQWVLHQSPLKTNLAVKLERGGEGLEKTVVLEGSWKVYDLSWRESSWYGLRQALHVTPLSSAEKGKRGLAADAMAFQVKNMYGAGPEPLRKAGLKIGDIILAVDGRTDLVTETRFFVHIRLTYPPGSRMRLTLLRGGEKMELEVPTW